MRPNILRVSNRLASDLAYIFAQFKLLGIGKNAEQREWPRRLTILEKRAARQELRRQLKASLALILDGKDGEGGTS